MQFVLECLNGSINGSIIKTEKSYGKKEKKNSQRIGQNWKKKQNKINSIFKLRCWKWKNQIGAVKTQFFSSLSNYFLWILRTGGFVVPMSSWYIHRKCAERIDVTVKSIIICFVLPSIFFFFPPPKSASKLMYCVGLNQTNVIIVVQFDVHK